MTNEQILKTWEANLLPYVKLLEKGNIDKPKRLESFNNWLDILVERGNISKTRKETVKYYGDKV